MKFDGFVGEGKKYDSEVREWNEELKDLFGFTPFEGTLNIAIRPIINEEKLLFNKNVITPFEDFNCLEGQINGYNAYFCYSKKRNHKDISTFYVISDVHLRSKLELENRKRVEIRIK